MMGWRIWAATTAAIGLLACGQPQREDEPAQPAASSQVQSFPTDDREAEVLAAVPAELLATANAAFTAIEPSEVGIFAAPTIEQALAPLLSPEAHEEGASVQLTVREIEGAQVADIVRSDIPDDSIAAGHIRIEFRQEPEGWFPTNAYRRVMCRRGAHASQWTAGACL